MPPRAFTSDNTAGTSPEVLAAVTTAATGQPPYGNDPWTERARTRSARCSSATST